MRLAEMLQVVPIFGIKSEFGIGAKELIESFRTHLRRAPIIVADNVWDYGIRFNRRNPERPLPISIVAPPFPEFWIEARYKAPDNNWMYFGGFFMVPKGLPEWRLNVNIFFYIPAKQTTARMLTVLQLPLNENGAVTPQQIGWDEIQQQPGDNRDLLKNLVWSIANGLFLTLTFMHCKNVTRVEHVPPPKLAKRNLERGHPPMLKYHTLEIEGLKTILKREGQIETVGLERALHICRGHFAHYPDSGPGLFGRGIHGDFWIPAHARGTEKKGVVVADYSVNPPRKESA